MRKIETNKFWKVLIKYCLFVIVQVIIFTTLLSIIDDKITMLNNNIGRGNLDFWDFLPITTYIVIAGILGILSFKIIEDGN